MSTLSRDDEVAHLARLARLAVTDEELDLFAGQLDRRARRRRPGREGRGRGRPADHPRGADDQRDAPRRRPPEPAARRRPGRCSRGRGRPVPRAADPGGGGVSTDLTTHDRRPSCGRRWPTATYLGRGHPGLPRPDRGRPTASSAPTCTSTPRPRSRARPRSTPAGDRGTGLAGVPVALKDVVVTEGVPDHQRLEDPRGLEAALRRHRRRAAQGRRHGAARQDQHGRVRDGLLHRELRLPGHPQPVGPRRGSPAAPPAARRRRSPAASRRGRSAPTPAARSASPPRSPAWSGTSPPTARSPATA